MENNLKDRIHILRFGLIPYREAWDLQKKLHQQRLNGEIPDTLILLEHVPVYTIGKHGLAENIIGGEIFLREQGIEVVQVDRGGDVTYHGPGQIVGYPIFHLQERGLGVRAFVEWLESVIQKTLLEFGIETSLDSKHPGIWRGQNKIAAIGIRVHKHVSMHGFALNVNTKLTHFDGIIPCGLQQRGVTSMEKEFGDKRDISLVEDALIRYFNSPI